LGHETVAATGPARGGWRAWTTWPEQAPLSEQVLGPVVRPQVERRRVPDRPSFPAAERAVRTLRRVWRS